MVHQLTAAVLLVLMTLVTATSQHGLNYCACLEEVLVGNCECPVETKEATESCCSHLDHSETCDDHGSGGNHKFECDSRDCLVSLYFETDDFQNSIYLYLLLYFRTYYTILLMPNYMQHLTLLSYLLAGLYYRKYFYYIVQFLHSSRSLVDYFFRSKSLYS